MTIRPQQVLALFGPTGAGKTDLAIALAERLTAVGRRPVAISADAYQLYRGLEAVSGAPSASQRRALRHLFVASHPIEETMSAGRFAAEAHEAIDALLAAGHTPIVVGGSGLYMQAALTDLPMRPPLNAAMATRASQVERAPRRERERMLAEKAPQAAGRIDPNDRYRAGRAVALAEAGEEPSPDDGFWTAGPRHPTLLFGVNRDRQELYARIGARVDLMVKAGAQDEVLRVQGSASPTARKVIGFDELPAGQVEEMKARTRRYAKRQVTWLRRMACTATFNLSSISTDAACDLMIASMGTDGE